jgi:hypothetical protein
MEHRAFIVIVLCSSLFIGEILAQIKQVEAKNVNIKLVESPSKNGEVQLWLHSQMTAKPTVFTVGENPTSPCKYFTHEFTHF